ncbi:SpoIVB peptidase [Anaerotignum faecicola]|jgi:stage IV sporulation protein B|nr:SpoIVB peptidase [Anaerotignum faecicola]HBD88351.1 SpoIVB peptidase [Tyzzerella sp.]
MQQKIRKIFLSVLPFFAVFIPILLGVPQSAQALERRKLIPVGRTVGVTMDTEGLLVLETGSVVGADNESHEPSKGLLKAGDRILQANGEKQENKEAFMKTIQQSEGKPICLRLERNGRQKEVKITPVLSNTAQTYQIGAWIRDSIQGIGTVTYYDAENGTFGALGHGVYDVDTDELMVIHGGSVVDTTLTEIVKGEKGAAGELIGQVEMQEKLAVIEKNTETGIYGKAAAGVFAGESYPVATKAEVKKGAAVLLSDLEGKDVQAYAIEIESLEKNGGRQHKDMNIRIMDERLLALTGGIVQGMSGSPILQDGKLVGAVTHVTLADPTKGYGIFMENMAA